jgi:hypothetical protein
MPTFGTDVGIDWLSSARLIVLATPVDVHRTSSTESLHNATVALTEDVSAMLSLSEIEY